MPEHLHTNLFGNLNTAVKLLLLETHKNDIYWQCARYTYHTAIAKYMCIVFTLYTVTISNHPVFITKELWNLNNTVQPLETAAWHVLIIGAVDQFRVVNVDYGWCLRCHLSVHVVCWVFCLCAAAAAAVAVVGSFGLRCWLVSLAKLSSSGGQLVSTMWSVFCPFSVKHNIFGI